MVCGHVPTKIPQKHMIPVEAVDVRHAKKNDTNKPLTEV